MTFENLLNKFPWSNIQGIFSYLLKNLVNRKLWNNDFPHSWPMSLFHSFGNHCSTVYSFSKPKV